MDRERRVFEEFIHKWRDGDSGTPETEDSLATLEQQYQVKLPGPYRRFLSAYGNISTQGLMASVALGEYELPDLFCFFSASEISDCMTDNREDIPEGLLCFASRMEDGCYLFDIAECNGANGEDAPVWTLSVEQREAFPICDGFIDFLEGFNEVKQATT